eukprot:6095709-Prymnesium_polylepis.1
MCTSPAREQQISLVRRKVPGLPMSGRLSSTSTRAATAFGAAMLRESSSASYHVATLIVSLGHGAVQNRALGSSTREVENWISTTAKYVPPRLSAHERPHNVSKSRIRPDHEGLQRQHPTTKQRYMGYGHRVA